MTACGSKTSAIDGALVAPCERPVYAGQTWRDLAEHYRGEVMPALDECADRMDLIRESVK